MTNDSKTDEESDTRDESKSGVIPIKANDDEDRYQFDTGSEKSYHSLLLHVWDYYSFEFDISLDSILKYSEYLRSF